MAISPTIPVTTKVVDIGLDEHVRVQLTSAGQRILDYHSEHVSKAYGLRAQPLTWPESDEQGGQRWTLRELMAVFGPHMRTSNPIEHLIQIDINP